MASPVRLEFTYRAGKRTPKSWHYRSWQWNRSSGCITGYKKEDRNISINNQTITIRTSTKEEKKEEGKASISAAKLWLGTARKHESRLWEHVHGENIAPTKFVSDFTMNLASKTAVFMIGLGHRLLIVAEVGKTIFEISTSQPSQWDRRLLPAFDSISTNYELSVYFGAFSVSNASTSCFAGR